MNDTDPELEAVLAKFGRGFRCIACKKLIEVKPSWLRRPVLAQIGSAPALFGPVCAICHGESPHLDFINPGRQQ